MEEVGHLRVSGVRVAYVRSYLLGWSVGSVELDDYFLRKVAVDLQLSIVNVDYR